MKRFSVDRIVENTVVLIGDQKEVIQLEKNSLPPVKEGDVLLFDGNTYSVSEGETKQKRKEVADLIESLFQ